MTPLPTDDREFLKASYRNVQDRPLDPGSAFYEPIYDHPGCEDPVDLLQTHIEWSEVESLQMFSGFRGSGKTTELRRLRKRLEALGYVVLYGDALNYVNPAEPIDISDLLISLAGAFSDALAAQNLDVVHESYWIRLTNYLTRTTISAPEATAKVGVDVPGKEVLGGLKAGVDLKLALQTSPSFRRQLQQFLANRIGELKQNVDKFIEEGVKAIRARPGMEDAPIVFIFDSLEQLRGSLTNEQEVIHSVERLFANHLRLLQIPYVHCIYTVPPWLKFVMPNVVKIVMIPSIRQWENDEARSEYTPGWDSLRALVRRRFGEAECERFFGTADGDGHYPRADQLIGRCGGHFRDLLLLLREALVRAKSLPVTGEVLETAISSVRSNFLPIAVEDARWLDQIGRLRKTVLPTVNSVDVNRLTRFLDTHFVLYLHDGDEWYDIHPLIREEVADLVARHGAAPEPAGAAG